MSTLKWTCPDCNQIFCSKHMQNHASKNKPEVLQNPLESVNCITCKAIEDHKKKQ